MVESNDSSRAESIAPSLRTAIALEDEIVFSRFWIAQMGRETGLQPASTCRL